MSHFSGPVSFLAIAAGLMILILTGCHSGPGSAVATPTPTPTPKPVTDSNDPNFVMAYGDGVKVIRGDVDKGVDMFLRENNKTMADVGPSKLPILQTGILENLVLTQLFLKEATKVSLPTLADDEKTAMERFDARFTTHEAMVENLKGLGLSEDWVKQQVHEKIIRARILEKEAYSDVQPNQAALMEIYQKNISRFQTAKKLRVSRILIHADSSMSPSELASRELVAKKALKELQAGKEFTAVARKYSEDASTASTGGDLGFVAQGQSEVGFDDVAFKMKAGQTSPVFQTELGYQIIRVTDVHPAGTLTFTEVEPDLLQAVVDQKHREQEEAFCKKLIHDSNVQYNFKRVELSDAEASASSPETGN